VTRLLLALVATTAAGCAGDPACTAPEPGSAEIGLGDLDQGFTPMSDGVEVPIVLGPQGLNMIVVSVRVSDLEPSGAGSYRVGVAIELDDQVVGGTVGELVPVDGGDASDFLGLRVIVTVAEVRPLDGALVDLVADVTDGCGRVIEAVRPVRLTL